MGFIIGFLFGLILMGNSIHAEAIKDGFAHYDSKSGNFEWNK